MFQARMILLYYHAHTSVSITNSWSNQCHRDQFRIYLCLISSVIHLDEFLFQKYLCVVESKMRSKVLTVTKNKPVRFGWWRPGANIRYSDSIPWYGTTSFRPCSSCSNIIPDSHINFFCSSSTSSSNFLSWFTSLIFFSILTSGVGVAIWFWTSDPGVQIPG